MCWDIKILTNPSSRCIYIYIYIYIHIYIHTHTHIYTYMLYIKDWYKCWFSYANQLQLALWIFSIKLSCLFSEMLLVEWNLSNLIRSTEAIIIVWIWVMFSFSKRSSTSKLSWSFSSYSWRTPIKFPKFLNWAQFNQKSLILITKSACT